MSISDYEDALKFISNKNMSLDSSKLKKNFRGFSINSVNWKLENSLFVMEKI